eukprot:4442500-Pleurochrysis_carterae.AAC.3
MTKGRHAGSCNRQRFFQIPTQTRPHRCTPGVWSDARTRTFGAGDPLGRVPTNRSHPACAVAGVSAPPPPLSKLSVVRSPRAACEAACATASELGLGNAQTMSEHGRLAKHTATQHGMTLLMRSY